MEYSDRRYLFGHTNHRGISRPIYLGRSHIDQHTYLIGRTGTGKSSLIFSLLTQSLWADDCGIALIDPHGDLAVSVASTQTESEKARTYVLDLASEGSTLTFNPLAHVAKELRPLVASGLLDVFRMMWPDAWGPRMEHVLRSALFALLDYPPAKLPDILRILNDKTFRFDVLRYVKNPQVLRFWKVDYPKLSFRLQADAIAPIQTKIGALLADPRIYQFLAGEGETLRIRRIMDERQILIVNLSKGRLGGDSARLVGALLTTMFAIAAFSRASMTGSERTPFLLFLDEFQSFTTGAVADMLSELRKYRVGLVMAHQYLHQLDPEIRHAVFGNVGTMIAFRVGAEDAYLLEREFGPKFTAHDLMNLPNRHIYAKVLIGGAPGRPFSAVTASPEEILSRR